MDVVFHGFVLVRIGYRPEKLFSSVLDMLAGRLRLEFWKCFNLPVFYDWEGINWGQIGYQADDSIQQQSRV